MPNPMHVKHSYDVFAEGSEPEKKELKNVILLINPKSGAKKGIKTQALVVPILEKAGINVRVVHTEYAGHAKDFAKKEDLSGVDALTIAGGDGSVHELVNGFLSRDDIDQVRDQVTIGIFPAGTGNTLAYDLHLNDAKKSAEYLVQGLTRQIDAGRVDAVAPNGQLVAAGADGAATGDAESKASGSVNTVYSINIIGYGLPSTVLQVANSLRWLGGAQYKLGAYHALLRNRGYDCDIKIVKADDSEETISGRFTMIQAQATIHMGDRIPFTPDSKLDNGLFELALLKKSSRGKLVSTLTASQKGKHLSKKNFQIIQCKSFELIPKGKKMLGPETVNVDGELIGHSPFKAVVIPKALRVVAP